jgi:anthranilate/para-aminobenzoate synthase component II
MFSEFPLSLINKLGTENLAFHAHDWVIDLETYKKSQQLSDFFEILATDKNEGMEFVVAVEAKNYPISGVMFHPET